MASNTKYNKNIPATLSAMVMLLACTAQAHERYTNDSIAAKYKNENAVYTNVTEKLVIKEEDGKLVANSYVTQEKLLISDLSLSNNNVDYFFHSNLHKLNDLNAVASLPAKTGYREVKCTEFANVRPRDYVFYDDNRAIEVLYSGLVKNSVTETKYSLEHTDINMLLPFEFQDDIPVVNATFEVVAPKYVKMDFVLKGENTNWIKQEKEEKNGIVTYKFTATDVPAFKAYDNIPSRYYYLPHVIPYITSYKLAEAAKPVEMLSNPDELYKYLYKYINHLNMKEDTFINNKVAELTKNDINQRDKAAHIYQWVQKNIHYIAFEYGLEGFTPREAALVCKRKYGDCKDMASLLVTMCRKAGLDAYFTWIGTRYLPYNNEETPLSLVNNHMICAVKLGGEWVFLDGTHPLLPLGGNRDDIQGKEAMIAIDAATYKIVTIPEAAADNNVTIDSTFITMPDDYKITGTVKLHYKGYEAWETGLAMQYASAGDAQEKAIKKLTERGSDKYTLTKYDIATPDNANGDVYINADFAIGDYVKKAGKQYYINMNLEQHFAENRINDPERKVPYYFDYKQKTKEVVTLEIPKGYRVTHLPAAAHGSVDGLWNYSITYHADAKKITLVKEYELNTLAMAAPHFPENNKTVDGLRKLYKESVVLTDKN